MLRLRNRPAIIVLCFIAAFGVWNWWQVSAEYQQEQRIADKILQAGGGIGRQGLFGFRHVDSIVLTSCQRPHVLPEDLHQLRHLQMLNLGESLVTDADLEHLRGLAQLEFLSLRGTPISDMGLQHLKGLATLRRLDLSRTAITDEGLASLGGTSIEELCLGETVAIEDDAGTASEIAIEHLKGMSSLKRLIFFNSPTNLADLQKALPNCAISP